MVVAVMTVDRSAIIRMLVTEAMTILDFQTYEAWNSDDALSLLPSTHQLDLLIVEFEPGRTNTLAVVEAFRAKFPNVRLLYLGTGEDKAPWPRLPLPCRYLEKPFTLQKLLATVSWLLA